MVLPVPGTAGGRLDLPRDPAAAHLARRFVDEHFAPRMSERAAGDLRLVVSELVTNAVVHGKGAIVLEAKLVDDDAVHLEVIDEGHQEIGSIHPREPAGLDTGGRGLRIVAALSRRWGAHEGTTHVWADVPLR